MVKLRDHIISARLPLAVIAAKMQNPASAWEGIGQGLRARTLRLRVKDWERAARYYRLAFGRGWPSDVGMVLDYIQTMRESGAEHSSIQAGVFALTLMRRVQTKCAHVVYLFSAVAISAHPGRLPGFSFVVG